MDDIEKAIQEAADRLLTALRIGKGLDERDAARLKESLKSAADLWSGQMTITKSAANLFVDLAGAIDACKNLYSEEEASRVSSLSDEVADLIRSCVSVE